MVSSTCALRAWELFMGGFSKDRRKFLIGLAVFGGATALQPYLAMPALAAGGTISRSTNDDPYRAAKAAVEALGGMSRFVKKGQKVCILPNLGWARTPEQGACTNPRVLRAVVHMCEVAGAKSIDVYCNPCNDA